MSSQDLYTQFKAELRALLKRYKSPDLNVFVSAALVDNDPENPKIPTFMYYSGSLREISYCVGDSLGKVVTAFEKKRNVLDTSIREEALQNLLLGAVNQWQEEDSKNESPENQPLDVPLSTMLNLSGKKPGNA